MDKVGFLGLGAMGGPMARNVVRKGINVKGFDLNAAAVQALVSAGGHGVDSLRDIAMGTDVVVTMLPDGPDVERAVLGHGGLAEALEPGTVLVDMSTINPAVTRRIGSVLAEKGVAMIDSPVGKSVDHAIAGTLSLMVGGEWAVIERVRPILDCMGSDLFHCGGLGMGGAMKLTNNFLSASILASTVETLVLGTKAGLSLSLLTNVMRTTMAWNNHLGITLPAKAIAGDISPGFMVKLGEKDLTLAMAMARELGVEASVGSAVHALLGDAKVSGYADSDITSLLHMLEGRAGVSVRAGTTTPTGSNPTG